jgi:hypothetical protein
MKLEKIFIPENSPFITTDTRQKRWAIPYSFECVNHRIDNLLWRQKDVICGKRVLDIASHMGTFSYAALHIGASFVHGVELEQSLVEKCCKLFEMSGVAQTSYRFDAADIFEFLENTPENSFDTALCFGMFYYTSEPYRLLKLMQRAVRGAILLDTFTASYAAIQGKDSIEIHPAVTDELLNLPMLFVTRTQPDKKDYRLPDSFSQNGKELSLTTFPTPALIELWVRSLGLNHQKLDWSAYAESPCHWRDLYSTPQKHQSHWADVYTSGARVSYRIQKQ